ncbi:response regulator transcription factor [Solirubrobacter taibaiensis]|nr:response regulator transcription factor [Solirubrobacter taibaiensis]
MLVEEDGVNVVASVPPGAPAARRLLELGVDVALVDVTSSRGLADARQLLAANPDLKVIGIGGGDNASDVLAWAEAGLAGSISAECSLADLHSAIETAARGEALCSPRAAAVLIQRVASLAGDHARGTTDTQPLTSRQAEILRLIECGLSNKAIARELCIELATVKNHVHTILEKLHVNRRVEAAAWAREAGLGEWQR